ncbi:MAG: malate synthase A [Planctomycetes bacterium]|nr:malate synthase A [Planctomycetota bacterium]
MTPFDSVTRTQAADSAQSSAGIQIVEPIVGRQAEVLSEAALQFVVRLERAFRGRREELLERRRRVQSELDQGRRPVFPPETRPIREKRWRVAAPPHDLTDRRVEITGPVERKMMINALTSGANVFMADFEDSLSPTWANVLDGQVNVYDAVRREMRHVAENGKVYELPREGPLATLVLRPRGWHLVEKHMLVDGVPVSASLFDFGIAFFNNAVELIARGSGPYFYLPKLENRFEARLWNDVFVFAQAELGIPRGTIRATVLIETILAAFEMDEILFELCEHSSGLNCGRWDYIFSFIKKMRADSSQTLPDRGSVTMEQPFLRAYSRLLIQTCHRRGAHAMGGMAAQIPIKHDAELNRIALDKVRADKRREANGGHDGTWVAHPGLIEIAREEFDRVLRGPHQIDVARDEVRITAEDLLTAPRGAITERGLRQNLEVGTLYIEAWLRGQGCVPIHNLMEDAATAEISRTQVWQWLLHHARLDDGRAIDAGLVKRTLDEELERMLAALSPDQRSTSRHELAAQIMFQLATAPELPDFLTTAAYDEL